MRSTTRAVLQTCGFALIVGLGCDDAGRTGDDGSTSLQIKGLFDNCPAIQSIVVSPSTVVVGQSGLATVTATDRDVGDVLTFAWTAASGTFDKPAGASSLYTCSKLGSSTLTVKVSDGRCDTVATVAVTCQAAP